jgi:glucose 1-dehydrogenase
MTGRLAGKIALVTGSDSGIGQATAIELAREGADVVVNYRGDREGADGTSKQVEALGRRCLVVRADVSDEGDVAEMFDAAVAEFGTIDILVNNAGVDDSGTHLAELDTQTWDRTIRVNLYGPFFCCRRFIKERAAAGGGGKIINITSVHQEIARAGSSAYDASKGGLRNLTTTLALELAPMKINVNNIAPGMVLTPINQQAVDDPETREEAERHIPWRRAGQPAEIGRLAVFLAGDDADYITGATVFIDGGLMLNLGQGA